MKTLTVTLRTVHYSTYKIEVDDDYMPENDSQIIEDWFLFGNDEHELVESEINDETVEYWDVS